MEENLRWASVKWKNLRKFITDLFDAIEEVQLSVESSENPYFGPILEC